MSLTASNTASRGIKLGLVALALHGLLVAAALVYLGIQVRHLASQWRATGTQQGQAALLSSSARGATPATPGTNTGLDLTKVNTTVADDFVYGSRSARISLISYMDFECPYCSKLYPVAKQLVDASAGGVNFILRPYPLSIHPHAEDLANAAECIAAQAGNSGFWVFSDRALNPGAAKGGAQALLGQLATDTHLDQTRLTDCVNNRALAAKVKDAIDDATRIGVIGTPTSILVDHVTHKQTALIGAKELVALRSAVKSLNP